MAYTAPEAPIPHGDGSSLRCQKQVQRSFRKLTSSVPKLGATCKSKRSQFMHQGPATRILLCPFPTHFWETGVSSSPAYGAFGQELREPSQSTLTSKTLRSLDAFYQINKYKSSVSTWPGSLEKCLPALQKCQPLLPASHI